MRTVLHCDCNNFFASVECISKPDLKNIPMAVCGDSESRHGIVLSKNELAKKCGVVTAETVWSAKKKCPELVTVPPHMDDYKRYSKLVNNIYVEYTDLVEPFGIDESWLDVTQSFELFGGGQEIADTIRTRVRTELGLTVSVGVSFNKIFAKLGSDYKKPDATTVISSENFRDIVFPLPASDLLYVGKAANALLKKHNIHTIGDIAHVKKDILVSWLGKNGLFLWTCANGLDSSPVRPYNYRPDVKSVSNGLTFAKSLFSYEDIKKEVYSLTASVSSRLKEHSMKCCGVQVTVKDDNFKVVSKQCRLTSPSNFTKDIFTSALDLVMSVYGKSSKSIRSITVNAISLIKDCSDSKQYYQLSLFDDTLNEKQARMKNLEDTVDSICSKYGKGAVTLGMMIEDNK